MEKFRFSNGQTIAVDSTGVVSSNIWDLEENAATDMNLFGWLHVLQLTAITSGGTEGLYIRVQTSDATALSTTPIVHGMLFLTATQMASPGHYVLGIHVQACKRYAGLWIIAHTTTIVGGTIDAWWEDGPGDRLQLQKKNASTGA